MIPRCCGNEKPLANTRFMTSPPALARVLAGGYQVSWWNTTSGRMRPRPGASDSNLLDIPEGHVGRKRDKALDVGAPRHRWRPLPKKRHRHIGPGILLQLAGNRLALRGRTGERP